MSFSQKHILVNRNSLVDLEIHVFSVGNVYSLHEALIQQPLLKFIFFPPSISDKTVDPAVAGGYLAFAQKVRIELDEIVMSFDVYHLSKILTLLDVNIELNSGE